MMHTRARASMVAVAAVALCMSVSGCAGGMSKPDLTVRLHDAAIQLQPGSAKEGPVKFDIDNTEAQNLELRIVRADDPAKLVVTPDGVLDVSKLSIADTVKEFTPG